MVVLVLDCWKAGVCGLGSAASAELSGIIRDLPLAERGRLV